MVIRATQRVYMPADLKRRIDQLVAEQPPDIRHFKVERLYYIVSLTYELADRAKGYWDGFTPIKAAYLRKRFRDYKLYVDYLVEHKILVCDNLAIDKIKSFGYKVADEWSSEIDSFLTSAPNISKTLVRERTIRRKRKYSQLRKWFDGLEVDYKGAMDYLVYDYQTKQVHPELRDKDRKTGKLKNPLHQYNSGKIAIQKIKEKKWFFEVDQTAGRLHTNLTNMKSGLRNFILWNGKRLVSVDISNSQPYLLTVLLQPSFYVREGKINGKLFNFYSITHHISWPPQQQPGEASLHTMYKMLQHIEKKEDIVTYKRIVSEGRIYEYMLERFREMNLISREIERKDMKTMMFEILYTGNQYIGQSDAILKRGFRDMFPNVYEVLSRIKRGHKTLLPVLMQKIEARLVLDTIVPRIRSERPDIPLFTIHDSIATTEENVEYVKRIMAEELKKVVGTAPQFKTEYWRPESLQSKINQSA